MKTLTKELISRGGSVSFFKHLGMLPNPDKILRNKGYDAVRNLTNDPHIRSCIQSRKAGVLSLERQIRQDQSDNTIYKFVKYALGKLDIQGLIRNILEAPLYGFQIFEIIWEKENGKYLPHKIEPRQQEYFTIGNNNKIYYKSPAKTQNQELPEYKFLVAIYEQSASKPYGESLLAKCFWPATFKNGGMRFWVNYIEKFGMPSVVAQYQRGASQEEVNKLAEVLGEMSDENVIVTPEDITIEMKETNKSSSAELFHQMIKHCNSEISKALLSQTLTTELDGGSLAAAETHFKVREEIIHSDIGLVEKILNDLIGMIVSLNFSKFSAPVFAIIRQNADMEKIWNRDIQLLNSGKITFTKEYWIENYGFTPNEFEVNI